jgi:hypothetical protein
MTTLNQDVLEDKLATALQEHILNRLPDPNDKEARRYVLRDVNSLLLTAGPGAEVEPEYLKRPIVLLSHLRASMQIPAQVLAKELPNRTAKWMAQEPDKKSPERPQWAEAGRMLLDQARLNQDESE